MSAFIGGPGSDLRLGRILAAAFTASLAFGQPTITVTAANGDFRLDGGHQSVCQPHFLRPHAQAASRLHRHQRPPGRRYAKYAGKVRCGVSHFGISRQQEFLDRSVGCVRLGRSASRRPRGVGLQDRLSQRPLGLLHGVQQVRRSARAGAGVPAAAGRAPLRRPCASGGPGPARTVRSPGSVSS